MSAHNAAADRLSEHKDLWYLEVIAVHPHLQARGLGGLVMKYVLEQVGSQPVYLECTSKDNIGFYERCGFRVVEKVVLKDDGAETIYWVMLREAEK